jgi:hypothetical protein
MALGDHVGLKAAEEITHETIPAIDKTLDDFVADVKGIIESLRGGKIHIEITFDFPERKP